MTFGRILATAVAAASALAVAPAADAHQADTNQAGRVIESVTRSGDVWDQSNWPGWPVIAYPYHGDANQKWDFLDDGTIRDRMYRLCATAIDDKVAGRECGRYDGQVWRGHRVGATAWMIENVRTRTCVTHNGSVEQLVLRPCEFQRVDQRWDVHS